MNSIRNVLLRIGFLIILCFCDTVSAMQPGNFLEQVDTATRTVYSLLSQAAIIHKALIVGTSLHTLRTETGELVSPVLFAATLQDPHLMEKFLALSVSTQAGNAQFASPLHAVFKLTRDLAHADQCLEDTVQKYRTHYPYSVETILIEQLSDCLPLIKAAANGNTNMVRNCLAYGLNVNGKDGNGRTALMHAARNSHYAVIDHLFKFGADTTIGDNYGRTAADYVTNPLSSDLKRLLSIHFPSKNNAIPVQYRAIIDAEQTVLDDSTPPLPPKNPGLKKKQKR